MADYPVTPLTPPLSEQEIIDSFVDDAEPVEVAIAGRMMARRVMGKASFASILDGQGSIQIYVTRDDLGEEAYAAFKKSDIGDIFGVKGIPFRTKTGMISVHVKAMTLLTKSLKVLPEKFHGLEIGRASCRERV